MNKVDEEFLSKLEEKLNETSEWPSLYMFKFIIPADLRKIALVESLFSSEAKVNSKESSGGKYISITGRVVMLNALEIISIYREAAKIEGLISL